MTDSHKISVSVISEYLDEQSQPENKRFAHLYHVTIKNEGLETAQLLNRQWFIVDANDEVQEVQGEGVIGKQPTLKPGDIYQYTSGTVIPTEVGCMHGSYEMIGADGTLFEAKIPAFTLSTPGAIN